MPSQPDSGDLATLSHPNQNVQLAHELATPEGNQTRLVSTDGVAHAYPAEEPAWQMPPSGPAIKGANNETRTGNLIDLYYLGDWSPICPYRHG